MEQLKYFTLEQNDNQITKDLGNKLYTERAAKHGRSCRKSFRHHFAHSTRDKNIYICMYDVSCIWFVMLQQQQRIVSDLRTHLYVSIVLYLIHLHFRRQFIQPRLVITQRTSEKLPKVAKLP